MSRCARTTYLLITALAITLSPLAMAWTPYGYGPYGPDYQGGYPEAISPGPQTGTGSYEPGRPPPDDFTSGYGNLPSHGFGPGPQQQIPYSEQPPEANMPSEYYSGGYAPPIRPPRGAIPGSAGRGFGPPAGFQISGAESDDAYTLTIELNGMSPQGVQVRPEGQSLLISRERTEQQTQSDRFDDGRGYMHSFSYSSGTTRRRLPVPPDGDLAAMTRKDGENSIQIRIPRRKR